MRWRQKDKVRKCRVLPDWNCPAVVGASEWTCLLSGSTLVPPLLAFGRLQVFEPAFEASASLQDPELRTVVTLVAAGPSELACAAAEQIFLWSSASQQITLRLRADDVPQHRCSIATAHEGNIIAAGVAGKHPSVLVWHRGMPEKPAARLKAHRFDIISLAFDADGETSVSSALLLL